MAIGRIAAALCTVLLTFVLAAPAFARPDGGEGLYGKTDDKVITNFGFGLIIGFALLVTTLSVLQYLLERRKQK
jgi:hypothetical protein